MACPCGMPFFMYPQRRASLIPVSTASAPVFLLSAKEYAFNIHWQNHVITEILGYILGILPIHVIIKCSGAQREPTRLIHESLYYLGMTVSLIYSGVYMLNNFDPGHTSRQKVEIFVPLWIPDFCTESPGEYDRQRM